MPVADQLSAVTREDALAFADEAFRNRDITFSHRDVVDMVSALGTFLSRHRLASVSFASAEPFLAQLRRVNLARYEAWVEGADAGIMFDALELGGEVGELLNVVKKLEREERGWRGSRAASKDFADECADVLICLDKLARRGNVDLTAVTISKFNATSEKVGLPHRLEALLGSRAPAEQEVPVAVAECAEPRPVGDTEIIQVEDRTGPQREAEGVPRDHPGAHIKGAQTQEAFLAQAVTNILPIGDNRAPGDRVIPIYVRMDELRALHALATSRSQHEGADNA